MANDEMIDLLREQVKEAEQELQALRSSLRYRIGDIVLQALPLSWRSVRVLPRLLTLYKRRHSAVGGAGAISTHTSNLPQSALLTTGLGLGTGLESTSQCWATTDAALMALRLRADAPVTSLVLRSLSVPIVRQLARVQQNGGKVIWWPDPNVQHSVELEAYVVALADECRLGVAS